jgi:uroporphyrinogen decarboxylase
MDAVRLIRHELAGRIPLIGFAGSPWTLACYMIEGRGSRDFQHIKEMLYSDPELLEQLLDTLVRAVAQYLNAQIRAGAQAVMLFDSWGGALTSAAYRRFSLKPMTRIISALERTGSDGHKVPVILFTKGGGNWLEAMADSGADVLGLDWTVDMGEARRRLGPALALQGNLDPFVLFSSPESIVRETEKVLESFGHGSGHIFNLGHGISQYTDPANAGLMIETVHSSSRKYHEVASQ